MISTRRKLTAPALAAAALLSLAGCAGSSSPEDSASPSAPGIECAPTGSIADSVTVSDTLASAPTVEFDSPLEVDRTEHAIVVQGDGADVEVGDAVTFSYAVFKATDGSEFEQAGYGGDIPEQTVVLEENQILAGFANTLACASVGSRVVGVLTADDAFGDVGSTDGAIAPGDALILVVDVSATEEAPEPEPTPELPEPLPRAEGAAQPLPEGFPTVTFADDGNPTVAVPSTDPPAELQVAASIVGTGEVVSEGATVAVHYKGVNWRTGEVFDESWARGEPSSFPTSGVIAGFRDALVGQTVGSQVVAIIPPDQGYGPQGGNSAAGIEADDTLVFVVDILATTPAS